MSNKIGTCNICGDEIRQNGGLWFHVHHTGAMHTAEPVTVSKVKHNFDPAEFSDKFAENIPLETALYFERRGDVVYTNVPHLCIQHSPDGFNFGYAGSGPADLALNYCEWYLLCMGYKGQREKCWKGECFTMSGRLHQDFKEYFLIVSGDKNAISIIALREWFQEQMTDELVEQCAALPEEPDEDEE